MEMSKFLFDGYLDCALHCSIDDFPAHDFTAEHVTIEAKIVIKKKCEEFAEEIRTAFPGIESWTAEDWYNAGEDFFLVTYGNFSHQELNEPGRGFMRKQWAGIGYKLNLIASKYPATNLYIKKGALHV